MNDTLADFEQSTFSFEGVGHTLYRVGHGPAVIVISEMPGITPHVADFARKVAGAGLTAVLPHVFGEDGREVSVGYVASSFAKACVSKEFTILATGQTSPVISWLRALARAEHDRCGGPGVGAVGMCFTGGFALAMMVEDVVVAPVLSQPSLPVGMTKAQKSDLGLSPTDRQRIVERAMAGTCVLGLRFSGDKMSPSERFDTLRTLLGDKFISVELDSAPGNPHGHRKMAHSVLTEDLDDRTGTPTRDALDQVLTFFRERLVG